MEAEARRQYEAMNRTEISLDESLTRAVTFTFQGWRGKKDKIETCLFHNWTKGMHIYMKYSEMALKTMQLV